MSHIELGCRVAVALIFAAAFIGKIRSRTAFQAFVGALAPFAPAAALPALGVAVIAAEGAVAVALAVPPLVPIGYAGATVMLAVFTGGAIRVVRRGQRVQCTCFGSRGEAIGPDHAVVNAVALIVAATGLLLWLTGPLTGATPAGSVIAAAVGLAVGLAVIRWEDLKFLMSTGN